MIAKRFPKPAPGCVVTVRTKHKSVVLGRGEQIFLHENKEVKKSHPKLDPPNTFIVATGNSEFPEAMINLDNVISMKINGVDVDYEDVTVGIRDVLVKGSKDAVYTVHVVDGVGQTCTCSGFQFRKTCRHLSEATKK